MDAQEEVATRIRILPPFLSPPALVFSILLEKLLLFVEN